LKGGPAEGTASTPTGRTKLANRGVLAGALVQQCLAQCGDSVQFHFAQELCVFDLTSGIAFFRPVGSAVAGSSPAAPSGQAAADSAAAGGAAQERPQPHTPAAPDGLATYPFDLLVGADGASSLVRQVLQRQDGALQVSAMRDIMEFKTFQMGSAERLLPEGIPAGSTFQTWTNPKVVGQERRAGRGHRAAQATSRQEGGTSTSGHAIHSSLPCLPQPNLLFFRPCLPSNSLSRRSCKPR
jgi:hypothetical protein